MNIEEKINYHHEQLLSFMDKRADLVRQYNLSSDPSIEDQINDYDEQIEIIQNLINELEE